MVTILKKNKIQTIETHDAEHLYIRVRVSTLSFIVKSYIKLKKKTRIY